MALELKLIIDDETLAVLRTAIGVVAVNPTPVVNPTPAPTPVVTPTMPYEVIAVPMLNFPAWWDNTYFTDQAQLEAYVERVNARARNMWLSDKAAGAKTYGGVLRAASLSNADLRYVYWASFQPGGKDIAYALYSGTQGDISRAINLGFTEYNGYSGDPKAGVSAAVIAAVEGYLKSVAP